MDPIDDRPAMRLLAETLRLSPDDGTELAELLEPLLNGGGRAGHRRAVDAFFAARDVAWPAYDARLKELGAVSDEAFDELDDDDIELVRAASDIGFSLREAALSFVSTRSMAAHRAAQFAEVRESRPFLRFRFHSPRDTKGMECSERDGEIARRDAGSLPSLPCWRPDCMCYFESLAPRDLARDGVDPNEPRKRP